MIFFAAAFLLSSHSWAYLKDFFDPNQPLMPKLLIVSVATMITFVHYKLRNGKKSD